MLLLAILFNSMWRVTEKTKQKIQSDVEWYSYKTHLLLVAFCFLRINQLFSKPIPVHSGILFICVSVLKPLINPRYVEFRVVSLFRVSPTCEINAINAQGTNLSYYLPSTPGLFEEISKKDIFHLLNPSCCMLIRLLNKHRRRLMFEHASKCLFRTCCGTYQSNIFSTMLCAFVPDYIIYLYRLGICATMALYIHMCIEGHGATYAGRSTLSIRRSSNVSCS